MIKSLWICLSLAVSVGLARADEPGASPSPQTPGAPTPAASEPSPAAAPAGEAIIKMPAKAVRRMKVPAIKVVSLKDAYTATSTQPHLLLILHLPRAGGAGYIEVHNKTKQDLAIFQFTLHALGHEGELEFEELPAGWSAVKEVKLTSLRELEVRTPRAYDKDATEIVPQLVIHRVDLMTQKLEIGKRKVEN